MIFIVNVLCRKYRQVRLEKEDGKRRTNELISQVDREKQINKENQKEMANLRKVNIYNRSFNFAPHGYKLRTSVS